MDAGRPLDDYRRKRDFAHTPEPSGQESAHGRAPVFVVHRHDASRLHFDLRLAMEGVLRSWAIPKGFSYDPAVKHLAVRTEDHPMAYETFAGVIPPGQYGAGTMTIWDRGTYEVVKADDAPSAVEAGELKVVLRGRRLRGEWHLVKTKGEREWLLFKSRDRYAGPRRDSVLPVDLASAPAGAWPPDLAPMRTAAEHEPFSDPAWWFELRLEGRRVLAVRDGEGVRWWGLDGPLPALASVLRGLRAERAVLDGVLVVPDAHGRPDRGRLEASLDAEPDAVRFYVFDLLWFEDYDLRPLPLRDRKVALRAVLPDDDRVLFVDHVPDDGLTLARTAAAAGLGGLVAKRADAPYVAGPSDDWREVPLEAAADARDRPVDEALPVTDAGAPTSSRVRFSNLEKVYWPGAGFTKGDLVRYYDRVADVLLPYLRDRPLHLYRWPDGIEGEAFYQKDVTSVVPPWVETVPIGRGDEEARYVVCNDRDTLLWMANLGSIDLHPWMSRREHPDSPDYAVVDLDPKDAPFAHVVQIARHVGAILRDAGLRPLVKTSGATGLHVHVPLAEGYTYDQARMFCEAVARLVVRDLPAIATVERSVPKRAGRVYVDYGQNRRGQTIVPPYVVRPVQGAKVSTPLRWDEVDDDLDPARFTIVTVPSRLEEVGDLHAPLLTDGQDLMDAIEHLQGRLG